MFDFSRYMPHGHCMQWEEGLVILHVVSDTFIALAYFSIPFALLVFATKRRDVDFRLIFFLFAAFILSCGLTHVFGISTLWYPDYWTEGWMKMATAIVSVVTAVVLWPIIPKALRIPNPHTLARANEQLAAEVQEHKRTRGKLEQLNQQLEERVAERTRELEQSVSDLDKLRHDMVTICAWTRRIRDHGHWVSFEEFMEKRLHVPVTHGISEEAADLLKKDTGQLFPPEEPPPPPDPLD